MIKANFLKKLNISYSLPLPPLQVVDPESSLQRACHTLAQLGRADGVVRLCLTTARHFMRALEEGREGQGQAHTRLYDDDGSGFVGHGRGRGGLGSGGVGGGSGGGGGGGGVGGGGAARWCGFLLDDPSVKVIMIIGIK